MCSSFSRSTSSERTKLSVGSMLPCMLSCASSWPVEMNSALSLPSLTFQDSSLCSDFPGLGLDGARSPTVSSPSSAPAGASPRIRFFDCGDIIPAGFCDAMNSFMVSFGCLTRASSNRLNSSLRL